MSVGAKLMLDGCTDPVSPATSRVPQKRAEILGITAGNRLWLSSWRMVSVAVIRPVTVRVYGAPGGCVAPGQEADPAAAEPPAGRLALPPGAAVPALRLLT